MNIKSNLKKYEVIIEEDLSFLADLLKKENTIFVVDKIVFELYEKQFKILDTEKLVLIEALEQNKVIDTALSICERLTEIPAKRNATIVSIGGGIIQDITGFVANITYRGIKWTFVPTTLLSACDSCIGGKTSLNYKKYKNLLGTFFPPDEIHICSKFFSTLSEKDFKSGLGEVVKFNIMAGESGLINIETNINSLLNRDVKVVNDFVESSLQFKKTFIEVDEFDRGERVKLNFAHTFGHAIEVVTDYRIPHGTAVAIGMIMANRVAYRRHILSEDISKRSEEVLLRVIDIDTELLNENIETYISAMRKDKKQTSDALTAVLMRDDDGVELDVVHDILVDEVKDAIQYFIRLYNA